MKTKQLLSVILGAGCLLTGVTQANAQSYSYFFENNHSARTIAPIYRDETYAFSETVHDALRDPAIQFGTYNHDGSAMTSFLFDERGVEDRNVDITRISDRTMLITAYRRELGSNIVEIRLLLVDTRGNILNQNVIRSPLRVYSSLYAMDAVFDKANEQIAICGMAVNGQRTTAADPKQAFVLTVDLNLAIRRMVFFNSDNGSNLADYDNANRVVILRDGNYYITGSENMIKNGRDNMAIRNMKIDALTLDPSPFWNKPLALTSDGMENSVDMVETEQMGGREAALVTLVNFANTSARGTNWGLMRIDPNTGDPMYRQVLETDPYGLAYAHNIHLGDEPGWVTVTGMEYGRNDCAVANREADPFMGTYDLNGYLANVVVKFDYATAVGNTSGPSYWTLGDIYSTMNGYPVPFYLNRFATRHAERLDWGALTAIFEPNYRFLNTKFIWTNHIGKTDCKLSDCNEPLNYVSVYRAENRFSATRVDPAMVRAAIYAYDFAPYDKDNCRNGYYRTTNVNDMPVTPNSVSVYPNPASQELFVDLSSLGKSNVTVMLTDINGRVIASLLNGVANGKLSYSIPASLANGIYYVRMVPEGKAAVTYKVAVQR